MDLSISLTVGTAILSGTVTNTTPQRSQLPSLIGRMDKIEKHLQGFSLQTGRLPTPSGFMLSVSNPDSQSW